MLLLLLLLAAQADADAEPAAEVAPGVVDETIPPELDDTIPPPDDDGGETLIAKKRDLRRVVGSAHTVDQETLERFEPDDVHRALRNVPGVYVRDEDGQGLRPNIGLRGASSDRSAKIVLLEDGVLFAPAPYAAPAAYYFPLTTRMVGLEIFKGPAAIRQGPHTVGGALNLRTRPTPFAPFASLDSGIGFVGPHGDQLRLHGVTGAGGEAPFLWGVLLEGARVQSDGFKHIDGDDTADTGFVRDDLMLKARIGSGFLDDVRHTLELKLGVQREESNETYLGLSDADFRRDALRRYAASADDHMAWGRTQGQLRYSLATADLDLDVVAYRHDLSRVWNKVNGLRGGPGLHDVLTFADVGVFPLFVQRLRRGEDLGVDGDSAILIGPNQRTFFSQGIAATARGRLELGPVEQRVELGLRLHQDGVRRQHSERGFRLVQGGLVDLGEEDVVTADNAATATALAVHVADEVRIGPVSFVPGVRVEVIHGVFTDALADAPEGAVESDQLAVLPGVGVAWQASDAVVVLAGVHRGFSPIAPGQSKDVAPETSINTEGGVRLDLRQQLGLSAEAIGFYSHYENILGDCTYSSGCTADVGTQTNGGSAGIGGAELAVRHELRLSVVKLKTEASYTFTRAVFLTTFDSSHPLLSRVNAGDEMAYVPSHQAAFSGAVAAGDIDLGLSIGLVSAMRDLPGQGDPLATERTDTQAVVDVVTSYQIVDGVRLALRVDNLFDQRAIVSRRPFGARPGKPLSALVSLELETP